MAPKSKLTPELQRKLTDALAIGATYDLACTYAGWRHE